MVHLLLAKALENLANMNSSQKIAIVGDMFELGDDTQAEHSQVGKKIKASPNKREGLY